MINIILQKNAKRLTKTVRRVYNSGLLTFGRRGRLRLKLTIPVMFGFAPFSSSSLATSVRPLYDAHIRAVHPPWQAQFKEI